MANKFGAPVIIWSLLPCMAFADLPNADRYSEAGLTEFKTYFSYDFSSNERDLAIRVSHAFASKFPQDCLISATVALSQERDLRPNVVAVSANAIDVESIERIELSASGVGDSIKVSLSYHLEQCSIENTDDFVPDGKFVFTISTSSL